MKTDIEIAQQATLKPIKDIADQLGLSSEDWEPYGNTKAKLSTDLLKKLEKKPDGKIILVTSINPTTAGEGKSTVTVGLGQALNRIGKKTDRKSTRLNSSHVANSYAVFCVKKKRDDGEPDATAEPQSALRAGD